MSGSVQYEFPLRARDWNLGYLAPRFSFSWRDDAFFDAAEGRGQRQDLPHGTIGQEAYWLLNATLTWRSPDRSGWAGLTVTGWIRNILEEKYRVQSSDATDEPFGFVIDVYGPPRTFGITVSASF